MGSRHPLDIFRSTDDGFDHASRRRRTVSGKVLGSNTRSKSEDGKASRAAGLLGAKLKPSGKAGASGRAAKASKPAKPKTKSTASASKSSKSGARPLFASASDRASLTSGKLLAGAVGVVAIFALILVVRDSFGGETLPTLKASEARELLDGQVSEDLTLSTVLAATYPPTDDGLVKAWAAHDVLAERGFESMDVASIFSDDGVVEHYQLVVGRAAADALDDVRDALRALDDWPHGARAPFTTARIIPHPLAGG